MPTLWDELKDLYEYVTQQRGGLISTLLLRDSEGNANFTFVFCVYVLPVLALFILYKIMWSPFTSDANTAEQTRVIEAYNRSEQLKIDKMR